MIYVTWHAILLEAVNTGWVDGGHKGMDIFSSNTVMHNLSDAQLDEKCTKKYPLEHYTTTSSTKTLIHAFMFMPNTDPNIWMLQQRFMKMLLMFF